PLAIGFIQVIGDLLTIVSCTIIAILIRRDILPGLLGVEDFVPVRDYVTLWPALILLLIGRASVGLYPGFGVHPAEDLRRQTWVTIGLIVTVLAGGALFSFSTDYSRLVLAMTALLLLVSLPIARSALRDVLARTDRFGAP